MGGRLADGITQVVREDLAFVAWVNKVRLEEKKLRMADCMCGVGCPHMHYGPVIGYFYITCDGCGRSTGSMSDMLAALTVWNKIHEIDG